MYAMHSSELRSGGTYQTAYSGYDKYPGLTGTEPKRLGYIAQPYRLGNNGSPDGTSCLRRECLAVWLSSS